MHPHCRSGGLFHVCTDIGKIVKRCFICLIDRFRTPSFRANLPPLYSTVPFGVVVFRSLSKCKSIMESSSTKDEEIYKGKRNSCCGWGHKNAAIIVAFLTLANGAVSVVAGVEGLLYHSILDDDHYVLQTVAGSITVFTAFALLVILFSRLKVRKSIMQLNF